MGKDQPTVYALEGSVAVGGAALKWLQSSLGILKNVDDTELVIIAFMCSFFCFSIVISFEIER